MIRHGRPSDAEAVARLHQRAWLRAYSDFIDPERILAWDMGERTGRWRERLTSSPVRTCVFEIEARIVGFASFGPHEEEDLGSDVACLWALYVEPAAQGAGVGSELLAHAESALSSEGYASVMLWVFTANEHGRRFYSARGWVYEEGSEDADADWAAPAVRYRKALT